MAYRQDPGVFDALQWTGTNADLLAARAGAYHGVEFTHRVDSEGGLVLEAGAFVVSVAANHWYVMGPMWGAVRSGHSEVVDPALFAAKFRADTP